MLKRFLIYKILQMVKAEAVRQGLGNSASSNEGINRRWIECFPKNDNDLFTSVVSEVSKVEAMTYPGGIAGDAARITSVRSRESNVKEILSKMSILKTKMVWTTWRRTFRTFL